MTASSFLKLAAHRWPILILALGLVTLPCLQGSEQRSAGENCLFLGHSFFHPVVRHVPAHAERAGFEAHEQIVVAHGGTKGSPGLFWKSAKEDVVRAKAWIETGEVDLVALTYHSGGESLYEHYHHWVRFALKHNPKTRFLIQATWPNKLDRSLAEFEEYAEGIETSIHEILGQLRRAYPETAFGCIPQGRWMVGLWQLHEGGKLPELAGVMAERGNKNSAYLFRDFSGHGGELAVKEGALIWFAAIYSIDLESYDYQPAVQADLKGLAKALLESYPVWGESEAQ